MIKRPIVLILGAGASAGPPLGFPTGRDLLMKICMKTEAKTESLTNYVRLVEDLGFNLDDLETFIYSLQRSILGSVDAFLEERREFTALGKSLIAAELIPFKEMGIIIEDTPQGVKWRKKS